MNGATLELTYDEDLDTGSAPVPVAFPVTVAGARRPIRQCTGDRVPVGG